jgi:hypothetical protein
MPLSPEALTANAEAVERLSWTFGLRFTTDPEEPLWFSVDGAEAVRRIARDSTGSVFALVSSSPRVLYVSSEGAAGIVAADLDAFLGLVMACPYWRDLLKFSGSGKLDEMRRAATVLDMGTVDDEELDEARALLKSEFAVAEPADPVGALHHAVSSSDLIIRDQYGGPFESLFNSFVIDEERMRKLFGA